MNNMSVEISICGKVFNRSGGNLPNSASAIMKKHPSWPTWIADIAKWRQVYPGTLTLEPCSPMPNSVLANISCLAVEPRPERFFHDDPSYVQMMMQRGTRRFYAAKATSASASYPVLVSVQEVPLVPHRLEVYADKCLRQELIVKDGDTVWLEITGEELDPKTPCEK